MFTDYRTHFAFAPSAALPDPTIRDAAARFRTLEAAATKGAEVRRARLAARTLRRTQKSGRTPQWSTGAGVSSTCSSLAR